MDVEGLLEVVVDGVQKGLFYGRVADLGLFVGGLGGVAVVRGVLHQGVHNEVAFRAQGFVQN